MRPNGLSFPPHTPSPPPLRVSQARRPETRVSVSAGPGPGETPARLFHLIWRCFLRGGGALPADGMQMLPPADGQPAGRHRANRNGGHRSHRIRGPDEYRPGDPGQSSGHRDRRHRRRRAGARLAPPAWHPVTTFYYRLPASPLGAPVLVIDGRDELLLNAAVLSDVAPRYAPAGVALAGASVPGRADPALEPGSGRAWARMMTPAPGTGSSWTSTPSPAPCLSWLRASP